MSEIQDGKVMTTFASLAILIACLGLFGLASFTASQRTKEIGIRKVMGASAPRIMYLLSKQFIKWILIANLIAWPVAYFTMSKWLQNFAYRIDVHIWMFVLSTFVALLIALITVSYQTIKAARTHPVNSLRYE
jgi:putative ABC transport system permease protein